MRKYLTNILIIFISIIIGLVMIEVLLRIFLPQNLNISQIDEERVYKHEPNIESVLKRQEFLTHVKINSLGLRDREYAFQKPANTERIAVVGDSFVFGYGVELNETFVKLLENKLNKQSNKTFEVMNFGTSAYGTEQEYLTIKNDVVLYSPDVIILVFFSNDLKDNMKFNLFSVKNNTLIQNPPQKITAILKIRNFISWHSHLYALIYRSVIDNQNLRNLLIKAKLLNPPYKEPSTDFDSLIYQNSYNADFEYSMNKTILLLNKIKETSNNHNLRFILLLAPSKEQVDDTEMKKYISKMNINTSELNATLVQDTIKISLRKSNITIWDLSEQFMENSINNTFYYDTDPHWNKKGHELAANIIYENLINKINIS